MQVNWGVIVEELLCKAPAGTYDTAKLYKQENVSLGVANTVKLGA